jgi:SAM-dependent methyltransferase
MLDWTGDVGRAWAEMADAMERQLAPVAEIAIDALEPRPGEHVLEIGPGAGGAACAIARRVRPNGTVTGLDVSPDLLRLARARAAGEPGIAFLEADAGAYPLPPGAYDALFSRFGTMFFADPPGAFARLRRALHPAGRAVFAVYADPADNPWATLPARVADAVLGPGEPARPGAPGPFAWAEPGVFLPILEGGGFRDIGWAEHDLELAIGAGEDPDPLARAVALLARVGPVARRLREAPPDAAAALPDALGEALAPHVREGWVRLGARVRVIRARP